MAQESELSYFRPVHPPTDLPYRIRKFSRVSYEPHHSACGSYNDDATLTLYWGGRGVYVVGKSRQVIERGMVGLVLPDPPMGLLMSDPTDPYAHFSCRFNGHEAIRAARRIVAEHGGKNFHFFHWDRWPEGMEILRRIRACWEDEWNVPPDRIVPSEAMLAELLSVLDNPPIKPRTNMTVQNLKTYLQDHLAEQCQLDLMTEYFGVSKSYLCRFARRQLGRTIVQAVEEIKITWAQVLLREPSLSIEETARRVGYDDQSYFSKVFKRHIGMSPTNWRKKQKS